MNQEIRKPTKSFLINLHYGAAKTTIDKRLLYHKCAVGFAKVNSIMMALTVSVFLI